MKFRIAIILLIFLSFASFGQSKKINIKGHHFLVRELQVPSEAEGSRAQDTLLKFYRIEAGEPIYVHQHYQFKDEGGDCNNQFRDIGSYTISGDTICFTTHHCQKTGLDPITEWEQQVYLVDPKGKLVLIREQYKEKGGKTWMTRQD